ncbi:MAG: ATP-dependent Clp protease proteolytic subunit [Planctomycetota bacterium]
MPNLSRFVPCCLTPAIGLSLLAGLPACAQDAVVAAERVTVEAEAGEAVELQLVESADTPVTEVQAEEADPLKALKKQIDELKLEAQLRSARLEAELAGLQEENARLKRAYETAQLQQRGELQPLELEKARLKLETEIDQARRGAQTAPLSAELSDLQTQQKLRQARLAAELADLKAQTQKLQAEQALAAAERQAEMALAQHQQLLLTTQNEALAQELRAARLKTEAANFAALAELKLTSTQLEQHRATDKLDSLVKNDLTYRTEPFEDGVLYVSDRRIALNGPIVTGTADYVTDRIHYFNNLDAEKPIFLMIDNCPGGSVMQGYRIVKAIEASDAPVHVVVKSFAASMAAVITTLAEHSYAYPDAVLLHHQMSSGVRGNMTDIEQTVEVLKEWEARLAVPVAAKMGLTLQEFKGQMYDNMASGDWEEFADRAKELKWVNHVVSDIREQGIRERPTSQQQLPWYYGLLETDERGQSYINLPPLEPMDAYLMYNPNDFFRVDGR